MVSEEGKKEWADISTTCSYSPKITHRSVFESGLVQHVIPEEYDTLQRDFETITIPYLEQRVLTKQAYEQERQNRIEQAKEMLSDTAKRNDDLLGQGVPFSQRKELVHDKLKAGKKYIKKLSELEFLPITSWITPMDVVRLKKQGAKSFIFYSFDYAMVKHD